MKLKNKKGFLLVGPNLFFIVLVFIFIFLPVRPVMARSLEIVKVDILAQVMPNGDLRVTESRTVRFNGQFRGMDQKIYFNEIEHFSEVLIREGDNYYQLVDQFPTTVPGTYAVNVYGDQYFMIDWSYDAYNETRTFTLEYTAKDAVMAHVDVAELYYKFIGDEWDFPASDAFVTLILPAGALKDDLRAWGHGPLHGEVEIVDANTISWWVAPLPERTYLEGRAVFPLSLVPDADRRTGKEALPVILGEEERWARQANLSRTARQYETYYSLALLAPVGLILFSMWRRALNRKNAFKGDYYRELPGDYSPPAAGYLWNKKIIKPEFLTAQILNLARMRHLKIEELPGNGEFQLEKLQSSKELSDHDQQVTEFIFGDVYDYFNQHEKDEEVVKKSVMLKQIEDYARSKPGDFQKFYGTWTGTAKKLGEEQKFFMQHSIWGWGCLPLILMIVLALVSFIWWELYILGAVLLLVPFILLFASPNTYYSEYGADQLLKWRAFRKFLLHFSSMDRSTVPSLIIWEHYLVYAVILGVARQVIDQLMLVFPRPEADPTFNQTSWSNYGAAQSLVALHSMNQVANSLNNTISGANSASKSAIAAASSSSGSSSSGGFSSGGGFGGGFSGGGGGGFGGGGGSFR